VGRVIEAPIGVLPDLKNRFMANRRVYHESQELLCNGAVFTAISIVIDVRLAQTGQLCKGKKASGHRIVQSAHSCAFAKQSS
jgi:hypothetical protein